MVVTQLPFLPSDDGSAQEHQQPIVPGPQPLSHSIHHHTLSNASTATVDIEAWTVSALESLNIASIARGTGNSLSIPLDSSTHGLATQAPGEESATRLKLRNAVVFDNDDVYGANITPPRRPLSRRDSMKKRDALRKGNEGSRQRRRWENDHLLHVPNVQPPQPIDWQIHPTHTVHATVPYQLAQYWDKGLRERVEERKAAFAVHRKKIITTSSSSNHHYEDAAAAAIGGSNNVAVSVAISSASARTRADVGKVPKDLRATAKRTPAVKSWLRVLEEPLRAFMVERGLMSDGQDTSSSDEMDSEDEEIVFVGRNGGMHDGKKAWKEARKERGSQSVETGMVLDSLGDDETSAFRRWLTHSISDYYGLDSKSVTVGSPGRRVVYVGVKQLAQHRGKHGLSPVRLVLPPPLWEMF